MFTKLKKILINDDRGSAIILALIIIAALATTGIGAARLTKSNISQTTSFEDGLKAYYAAEAGVEAALLEWRFDHDVEFWNADKARTCYNAVKSSPDTLDDPSCELAKMTRIVNLQGKAGENPVDITNNKFDAEGNVTNEDYKGPTNQPWYELKIYYRDPKRPIIGNQDNPKDLTKNPVYIDKDQTYEVKFPVSDNVRSLYLQWANKNNPDVTKLMWHPIAEKNGQDTIIDMAANRYYSQDFEYNFPVIVDSNYSSGLKSLRVKCLSDNQGVYLSLYAEDENFEVVHLPTDEVNIEVVGHYNNTERKITYKLSRQAGTIMDIFDFGVFSQSSLRK
ncbi:MAG: hypothetical protein ACOZAR_05065 [Patescibacteria group bacterium]